MGQGTESCGGYEVHYDEYEEGLAEGVWTERNGNTIHVSEMTSQHLRNTLRLVNKLYQTSTFESEADKWHDWIEVIENELARRPVPSVKKIVIKREHIPVRGAKTKMKCHCGSEYEARNADLKRGYGYSCSKRCSAIRRDYGRPAAKPMV